MIRAPFLAVLFAILFTGIALAQAKKADPDLLPPDPKGQWRTMTHAGPANSCDGSLRSTVCAVETWMACMVRGGDLCRQVIGPDWPFDQWGQRRDPNEMSTAESRALQPMSPTDLVKYRVQWSKRVGRKEEDMWMRGYRDTRVDARAPGDVVVGVTWAMCSQKPDRLTCHIPLDKPSIYTTPKHATQVTLRRRPDGDWYVVHWGSAGH